MGTATRVAEPPVLDGRLDDVAWNDAEILSGFVQQDRAEGEPVSERTEIRLVYDESALYVGAWMFVDDPSIIVFGETRRDAGLRDTDSFIVVLDTYLDRQNGFVFGTSPAGIEFDGQITRDGQGTEEEEEEAAEEEADDVSRPAPAVASTLIGTAPGTSQPRPTRTDGTPSFASLLIPCAISRAVRRRGA